MKIRNDLIRIQNGTKRYDFNNLILDELLKRYVHSQLDKQNINKLEYSKKMTYCLLKFDTEIEISPDMVIHNQDFDIAIIPEEHYKQEISERQIIIQYNYEMSRNTLIYDYKKKTIEKNEKDYQGKKITAIAFNSTYESDEVKTVKCPVCAILDTSNYNIYLQDQQDFSITRRDIITTDADFYTENIERVPGPAHLAPDGIKLNETDINNAFGILYSVGLGKKYNQIEDEKELSNVLINNNEFKIKGIRNFIEYSKSNNLNMILNGIFNDELLERKKYIILKYKLYQSVNNVITDTGYWYYQSIPVDKYGKTNLIIRYERS